MMKTNKETKPTNDTRFQPGQSGNLAGRRKGVQESRYRSFKKQALEHWERHGEAALDAALAESPLGYCKMMLGILPKETSIDATLANERPESASLESVERFVDAVARLADVGVTAETMTDLASDSGSPKRLN